jgi:hypothetical protein
VNAAFCVLAEESRLEKIKEMKAADLKAAKTQKAAFTGVYDQMVKEKTKLTNSKVSSNTAEQNAAIDKKIADIDKLIQKGTTFKNETDAYVTKLTNLKTKDDADRVKKAEAKKVQDAEKQKKEFETKKADIETKLTAAKNKLAATKSDTTKAALNKEIADLEKNKKMQTRIAAAATTKYNSEK